VNGNKTGTEDPGASTRSRKKFSFNPEFTGELTEPFTPQEVMTENALNEKSAAHFHGLHFI